MKRELLRLKLQFFAGEIKEEEDEVIIPGEEGVTGASGVTGSTPPAYNMPQNTVAAPVAQDFDTWYKANGGMDEAGYYAKYDLDPDRDYQNTVNTLNYEYQTSMANYGEQAEKMYQMGLQNSGVSDIFQANAFSSYLGNMNQAAADRITARKKNKAAFEDYVAGKKSEYGQYESGIKNEYDTKLNSALTYALSKYNGYNLNQILSELGVSGYYTEIVQDVANRLSGMDSTTLKAETEGALAQSIINSISGFTGSDADLEAAKSMFGGMFPDDVISAAFGRAQAIYNNSPEAADATVQSWVDTLYGSFTGNEVDFDDWDNYQLADVPENLRVKIKEAIRQQFDSRVNTIYDAIVAEYSPDQKEGIRSYYTQKGYSKYEIDAAIRAAEDFYNKNPNTQAETVKGFIDQYYGNYDGTNIDSIDLGGIKDADMQTKVKEGIQQRFKDNVAEIYTMIREKYTPENANAMKLDLQNSYPDRYTQYEINAAFDQASAVYQNSLMGQAATTEENVNAIISSFGENGANFDPSKYGNDKQAFITDMTKDGKYTEEDAGQAWEQMKANWDAKAPERVQAIVDGFGFGTNKFDPTSFNRNEEAFVEQVMNNGAYEADAKEAYKQINEYMNTLDTVVAGVWLELGEEYTGSNEEKSTIDNYLQSKKITNAKERKYILEKIEEKKTQKKEDIKQDTLTGIEDLPENEVNYNTLYNEIQNSGNDPDITAASSVKLKNAVMGVLNDDTGEKLANAYKLIPNMSQSAWGELSDKEKLDKFLDGIGQAHKNGVMMGEEYYSVIGSWVNEEIKDKSNITTVIDMLKKYRNSGYLSGYYYIDYFNKIAQSITPNTNDIKMGGRYGDGTNEYRYVKYGDYTIDFVKTTDDYSNLKNGTKTKDGTIYLRNGTEMIYVSDEGETYTCNINHFWGSVKYKNDFVKDKDAQMILELIASSIKQIKPATTVGTPSGDSTSDNFKVGNQSGGRTEDFANENK